MASVLVCFVLRVVVVVVVVFVVILMLLVFSFVLVSLKHDCSRKYCNYKDD